jgi:uncharacterized protein
MLDFIASRSCNSKEGRSQRTMSRPLLLLFVLGLFTALPVLADDINNIHPTSFVTDLAGVIPNTTKDRLETLSTELQQKTGAQFAIITVRSLDDRPIEDYANDLFHRLGFGQKGQNNGLLLLLAPNDRKYRIEVGYGLEPVINDARAGDAGRAMVPFLRQDDYGSAVEVAAWQLAKFIADDKGATLSGQPPARSVRPAPQNNVAVPPGFVLILAFIVVVILMSAFANARRMGGGGGCIEGCLWAGLFNALGGRRGGWSSGGGGSDWGGGGFGGGGGDSGGGFGGFGGGDSGGGGASGSW